MKNWNPKEIRARIDEILPPGKVIPRHNKEGHFYEVREGDQIGQPEGSVSIDPITEEHIQHPNILGPVYPSVTGKLQVLKDQGLMNYKMNRAVEYVFGNFKSFTDENIMEHLDIASRVSQDILEDAGDIGTRIHNYREAIFNEWIRTGARPLDFTKFIPAEDVDVRAISGVRALQAFCIERDYIPVICEKLVFSHEDKVAGTLDDLGLMRKVDREGSPECDHKAVNLMQENSLCVMIDEKGVHRCLRCDLKYHYEFVLMDIKTSNQLKDHYFFQVCLYWKMFWKLLGSKWKPERCIIVQLSKENGRYKIEDLKKPAKLAQFAKHMLKTNEAVDFIKSLRKDNQKVVAPVMQL